MEMCMKGIGSWMYVMVTVYLPLLMVTFITGAGLIFKSTAKEFSHIKAETNMMANGIKVNRMAMEYSKYLTEISMMAIGKMIKGTEKESSC